MTRQEILNEIERIDCQLSPENLHCDGELPIGQVHKKYKRLMAEKNNLEKQLAAIDK